MGVLKRIFRLYDGIPFRSTLRPLYAAGLSTRDIRAHLEEVYGLRVSADLISRVTDAVLEEVSDWQNRALEPVCVFRGHPAGDSDNIRPPIPI